MHHKSQWTLKENEAESKLSNEETRSIWLPSWIINQQRPGARFGDYVGWNKCCVIDFSFVVHHMYVWVYVCLHKYTHIYVNFTHL